MVAALLDAMLLLEFLDHRGLHSFGRLPAAGLILYTSHATA
jgi:hypothetical protein